MFDGVNVQAVGDHRFEEHVLAELSGYLDWDGSSVEDVAHFAWVAVTAPPRVDVAHDHQLRPQRPARPGTRDDGRERVGGVPLPGLAILAGCFPGPKSGELQAVHERHTGLGW